MKRCLGAVLEPLVVESLSFFERTERERFLGVCESWWFGHRVIEWSWEREEGGALT